MRTTQCATNRSIRGALDFESQGLLPKMPRRIHSEAKVIRYRWCLLRNKLSAYILETVPRTFAQRPSQVCSKDLRIQNIRHARIQIWAQIWLPRQTSQRRWDSTCLEERQRKLSRKCRTSPDRPRTNSSRAKWVHELDQLAVKSTWQRYVKSEQFKHEPSDEQGLDHVNSELTKDSQSANQRHQKEDGLRRWPNGWLSASTNTQLIQIHQAPASVLMNWFLFERR